MRSSGSAVIVTGCPGRNSPDCFTPACCDNTAIGGFGLPSSAKVSRAAPAARLLRVMGGRTPRAVERRTFWDQQRETGQYPGIMMSMRGCDGVPQLAPLNLESRSSSAMFMLMHSRPRISLGVFLSVLIAIALIAQGASGALMDFMMAGSDMSASGHMPCSSCDGDNGVSASPCAVPCLAGLAVLLSVAPAHASQATFPVSMANSIGAGQIRAPDPNPPQR